MRGIGLHRPAFSAALAVLAAPVLAVGLLGGDIASLGPNGGGDIVFAVPADGTLGPGSDERERDDLEGAHPVTDPTGTFGVQVAVARAEAPSHGGPDVSDTAVPERVLAAYAAAAESIGRSDAGCNLTWPLLAGIGKVESGHAGGGAVDRTGLTLHPILGPVLDGGPGIAAISDSDGGRWDTDRTWDRAVGPMQFIPSSWRMFGADGNGDGRSDPNNVADAALASAGYLCSGDRDMRVERDRRAAAFSYNHSWDYVDLVLAWADAYAGGTPVLTGTLPVLAAGETGRGRPVVDAGRPTASDPVDTSVPAGAAPLIEALPRAVSPPADPDPSPAAATGSADAPSRVESQPSTDTREQSTSPATAQSPATAPSPSSAPSQTTAEIQAPSQAPASGSPAVADPGCVTPQTAPLPTAPLPTDPLPATGTPPSIGCVTGPTG